MLVREEAEECLSKNHISHFALGGFDEIRAEAGEIMSQ